jgi:hypothetical protein
VPARFAFKFAAAPCGAAFRLRAQSYLVISGNAAVCDQGKHSIAPTNIEITIPVLEDRHLDTPISKRYGR